MKSMSFVTKFNSGFDLVHVTEAISVAETLMKLICRGRKLDCYIGRC